MTGIVSIGLSTLLTMASLSVPGLAPRMKSSPAQSNKGARTKPNKAAAEVDPAVPSAAWRAMANRDVVAAMADGTLVAGRLAGYDGEIATLINPQGVIQTVATKNVTELRVAPSERPREDSRGLAVYTNEKERALAIERKYGDSYTEGRGTGRLIAGGLLVTAGVPQLVAGIAVLVLARRKPELVRVDDYTNGAGYRYESNPERASFTAAAATLLSFGLVHLAVGIPLLVTGKQRRERYSEWLEERAAAKSSMVGGEVRIAPLMGRVRGGWTVGLQLRF